MSHLNLNWLADNLNKNPVIFDIGCADMYDTVKIRQKLPGGTYYAFECSNVWRAKNLKTAEEHHIKYFHKAMSDTEGVLTFYPSEMLDGTEWPWSGSICKPGPKLRNPRWTWGNNYIVESITLNTFCNTHHIHPDFIHIDVQGAEHKVFAALNHSLRPSIVWVEISEFHMYETGTTYEHFLKLMTSLGYQEKFKDNCDALYVLNQFQVTEYNSVK